ncbi:hypothetical protein [Clostridium hydrogenum]|uniref:hypothetical protein n=1 Tax=Clostridium hydrogenum TaxID=2855764 RepID=UPI001F1802FA|nr:hypothetical protein [Clostridium hydrogenum]
MKTKDKTAYAPNKRDYFEQKPKVIKSYSKYDCTKLPDPVRDPIVSNNISSMEFDYTYNRDDDL